jgi:uncharacterized membrane protein YhaH (DUF805 family)
MTDSAANVDTRAEGDTRPPRPKVVIKAGTPAPLKPIAAVFTVVKTLYALLAAWDLWVRPAEEVRGGRKWPWALLLMVDWIGPTTYFYVHRRR